MLRPYPKRFYLCDFLPITIKRMSDKPPASLHLGRRKRRIEGPLHVGECLV